MNFTKSQIARLEKVKIIWIATLNEDKPHLVPIWFQLWEEKLYCCTGENSIKIKNIKKNPKVSV